MKDPAGAAGAAWAIRANRFVHWLSHHWLLLFACLVGLWVTLPWLAPLFMAWGWTGAAKAIYLLYAFQCHQLPQRSFFLFGQQPMYSLPEIQAAWQQTNNPAVLRQFIGNPEMGWKVAWSDRMVSLYTGILLWVIVLWPLRKRIRPLPVGLLLLLLAPMAVDGSTHLISDLLGGIGGGFRDSNAWLATLTRQALPANFYAGDALGSFNSWMRLITGLLFSLGLVWWLYPTLQRSFEATAQRIEAKFRRAGLPI